MPPEPAAAPVPPEPAAGEAASPPVAADPPPAAPARLLDRLAERWPRIDGALFPLFAGACVLYAASAFYGSMHRQTHGVWSAPLDDVFIHFDYARATARGYPFEWSEGNGFSSGNTSLAYPFVLSFGYWIGFRGLSLMLWAAIVACVSTFGFLLAAARLTEPIGRWAKYLIPPAVLALGALNWTLWSGMENAFHLGVWGLALAATLAVTRAEPAAIARRSWLAGLAGALLFATRPESAMCVAAFAVFAALAVRRSVGWRVALATVLRIGLPGALVLVAQAAANRAFTGEWSANGAIAKLVVSNPYTTPGEKWGEYRFLLDYVVNRNTEHHFADEPRWGWMVPYVALIPLFSKRTRAAAILLWASALGWLALVAMNLQVRWQNERYTMAAVAWILVLAAMGLGVLCAHGALAALRPARGEPAPARPRVLGLSIASARVAAAIAVARVAAAIAIAILFERHQRPKMRDQIWFFGRASRNIHDQHIVAGKLLAQLDTRRVLVGDAGALLYASDRPGLDLIGLGGYRDLPFARAGVHGLGASLELIERMRPGERPDTMAIYPSWWGDLPTLFGRRIAEIPVFGNVICGGAEKVIYRADWSALDRSPAPRTIRAGERVVDELDVADLVSEREHGYVFPHPSAGFVNFRILPDGTSRDRDLFDAGRIIAPGARETARVRTPKAGGRLVLRAMVSHRMAVDVSIAGRSIGKIALAPSKAWLEPSLDLPAGLPAQVELVLEPTQDEWLDCHVWILEGGGAPAEDHPPAPRPAEGSASATRPAGQPAR